LPANAKFSPVKEKLLANLFGIAKDSMQYAAVSRDENRIPESEIMFVKD